jgi:DUF4097 and DUF4098 domain-containing protein YvlB
MRTRLLAVLLACSSVAANASAPSLGDTVREVTRDALRRAMPESPQSGAGKSARTEPFSRKLRLGRDGRVSVSNVAGDIVVTGGSGDEVSIEATKRALGAWTDLSRVRIEVSERAGRLDVQTVQSSRADWVSVDYAITLPVSASIEVHSFSGDVRVSNVQGVVRAETVSGGITLAAAPRVELAKSVSGDVDITGLSSDSEVTATTVSGEIRAKDGRARALTLASVCGDVAITDVACDRIGAKTVSGMLQISGALAKNGRYDLHSFSGTIRLLLTGRPGFDLDATSFSGSIRSDWPLPGAGEATRSGRAPTSRDGLRGSVGDGSATVTIHTFSGDIRLSRR